MKQTEMEDIQEIAFVRRGVRDKYRERERETEMETDKQREYAAPNYYFMSIILFATPVSLEGEDTDTETATGGEKERGTGARKDT